VSDGSTDRTAEILRSRDRRSFRSYLIGHAAKHLRSTRREAGEWRDMFFQDARQRVETGALRALVRCFADEDVGAVSGELLLEAVEGETSSTPWASTGDPRRWSASLNLPRFGRSALRSDLRNPRELYTEIPSGTILVDVFVPMHVARAGNGWSFSLGIARDRIFVQKGKEFSRKVRTLTGNYQLLRIAPWLLSLRNPLLFAIHQPQTVAPNRACPVDPDAG